MEQLEKNRREAAVKVITGCRDQEMIAAFVSESKMNPLEASQNDIKLEFDLFSLRNR